MSLSIIKQYFIDTRKQELTIQNACQNFLTKLEKSIEGISTSEVSLNHCHIRIYQSLLLTMSEM